MVDETGCGEHQLHACQRLPPAGGGCATHRPAIADRGIQTPGAAAARIDGPALERALDDIFATGSFERMVDYHPTAALVALGDAWARGEVDVAGEHAASAAALRRSARPSTRPEVQEPAMRRCRSGFPPGSRHELPALGFATALRRNGISATYLGPDVPIRSWVTAGPNRHMFERLLDRRPDGQKDVAGAAAVIAALRYLHPHLLIAVGGKHSRELSDASAQSPAPLVDAVADLRRLLQLS